MHRNLVILTCLTTFIPSFAQAAGPMERALSAIPGDAVGFLCVPSIRQMDGKWQQAVTNLGLQQCVQAPFNSPIALLQQFMQMTQGLDVNGPLIIVQMPFENLFEQQAKQAFILPAEDPAALVAAMGGQAGEGGVWNLPLFGMPASAVTGDKHVVVGQSADTAKAVAASKGGMDAKLKAEDLAAFKGLDFVLWVDGERLLKVFKPQIDSGVAMIAMMQAASGPFGAKQGETTKKQIDMLVEGAKSVLIGLSLDPAGVGLRFALTAKPGSELARQIRLKLASDSLVRGLPAGSFMFAGGQVYDADQISETLKQLDPYFEVGDEVESINAEQLGILKGILTDWAPLNRGVRLTIEALPPGPSGVVGMSLLFDTSDSRRWLELVGNAVEALKGLSTDEDAQMISGAASYTADAEEIAGVKVAHLKLDLSKVEAIDEDDLEEIMTVLGTEGLLFRLAAAGPSVAAVSFGGGADYMQRLLTHADKTDAPLDNTPGIQKVAGHLPKKRASVGYVAVDQIMACIANAAKALEDDEDFPFRMPQINAPLAMASTGGDGALQFDVFFPTELVVASKDVIMTMLGSAAQGGQEQPVGAPE